MTETDRLRAALRLCAVVVRHVEEDGCPHGSEHCFPGEHPCTDCRAAIYAATLALRAVAPDVAPRDAVLDWSSNATDGDPEIRARALALVREAGLAEPTLQPFDPKQWSGATVAQVGLPEGVSPDEVLAFLHGWGARAVDPTGGAGQLAQAFTAAFLRRDPHAAAPGDTLAVAEVETLVPVDHAGHRVDMPMSEALRAEANGDMQLPVYDADPLPEYDFAGGVRGKYTGRSAGAAFACECCKRTLPAALAAGDDDRPYGVDHLCTECARTCGCYSDVGDIYGLVENCFVAQAHAFAAELRDRLHGAEVLVCDGWSVKTLVDGVARTFRPDREAVETLRRAVADELQRPALLAALARWEVT